MFTKRIDIYKQDITRDELNEKISNYIPQAVMYAQVTEYAGRENLYAGRICCENEIVFTVRSRFDIEAEQFVKWNNKYCKIISLHREGKTLMHIKININDND